MTRVLNEIYVIVLVQVTFTDREICAVIVEKNPKKAVGCLSLSKARMDSMPYMRVEFHAKAIYPLKK